MRDETKIEYVSVSSFGLSSGSWPKVTQSVHHIGIHNERRLMRSGGRVEHLALAWFPKDQFLIGIHYDSTLPGAATTAAGIKKYLEEQQNGACDVLAVFPVKKCLEE